MRPIVAMRSAAAANCEATSAFADARLCSESRLTITCRSFSSLMIGLLAQEHLILDQFVLLTKQSFVSGERRSQPDFR